ISCDGDFTANILAIVAAIGKDQQHRATLLDGISNFVIKRDAWPHVTWRDPATHAPSLQLIDHLRGGTVVFADVTDEQKEIVRVHANTHPCPGPTVRNFITVVSG